MDKSGSRLLTCEWPKRENSHEEKGRKMIKKAFAVILLFGCLLTCCTGCAEKTLPLVETDLSVVEEMLNRSLRRLCEYESHNFNVLYGYDYEVTSGDTTYKYPGRNGKGVEPEDWHFDEIEFLPTGYSYEDCIVLPFQSYLSIAFADSNLRKPGTVYMFLILKGTGRSNGLIRIESADVGMAGQFSGTYDDYLEEVNNYVNVKRAEEISVPFGKIS